MVKNSTAHRPTRRGTVLLQSTKTSELISAEALQHVVLPKKKDRQEDKEIEREDPIGDQMTNILNLHPGFCYDPAASSPHHASGEDEGFTISPILCRHNWKHLKHVFRRVKSIGLPTVVLSIIGFCCERSPSRQKFRETLQSSLLLFFALLVLGLSSILAMTHITTMWLGKEAALFVIQLLLILVDWNEMEKTCPPMIKSCIRGLTNLARCVDQYLLFGKRFAGREWNGEDFEFENPMGAQSRHADLWTLPPPCIKEAGQKMCLDLRYMKRDEWGQDTTKHVVAINFSYVMMREEHIRKRAGRSTIFHQQRSTSMALVPEGEWGPGRNDHTEENNTDLPHARVVPTSEKLDIINAMDRNSNNSPTAEGIELVHDDDEETLPEYQLDQLKSFATMIEDDNDVSCLLSPTGANDKSDNISITSSVGSCSSAAVADMNWVDISAKIGMRVLNSAHLQRVVASQEAAERLKNITEQFVVSPKENARKRNQTMDFAGASSMRSPGEISTVGPSSTVNKVIQGLPKSPCRPVHSMWTSAAAAGANSEDEQSNESTSEESAPGQAAKLLSEPEYLPSTPPKIIRTQKFPTTETSKSKEFTSVSPLRDAEDPGLERNQAAKPTTRKPVKCDLICEPSTMTDQSEQAYEVIGTAVDSTYDIPDEDKVFEDTKQEEAPRRTTPIEKKLHRRAPLAPGVKVAAPMCPLQPGRRKVGKTNYQMATVVSSERVWVDSGSDPHADGESTNCLSVTCKVDKSFLRNGDFMELTFRVLDEWSARYMPKHSKVPIGSCVATSYGVGVVVGWRVEDDCHVVRSLWQRRGPGAAHAYLTRDAIHCVLEAAIGFVVDTKLGPAKVLAYVDAGPDFQNGRYIITLQDDEVYRGCVFALKRDDIYSCHGAQFMPVTEYIKEACHYQIMLDNYKALVRQQKFSAEENRKVDDHLWKFWSENLDILWQSFLKATSEDREFDEEIDSFMGSIIDFLERLDRPSSCATKDSHVAKEDRCDMSVSKSLASIQSDCDDVSTVAHSAASELQDEEHVAGFWILDDILGGVFQTQKAKPKPSTEENILGSIPQENQLVDVDQYDNSESYKRAFAVIRTLMKTVSLARAASVGKPQFRLAMTICREFLMFVKTLIKVQQKNVSKESLRVWKSALEDIVSFFGPIKERLEKIARGIATRMEQQGRRAKIKVLRFADSILLDELFVSAACRGDWEQCLLRIENSMVKAKIIDEASCVHYRKTARFLYEHLVLFSSRESSAAARNNEKLALLAKVVQFFASPKRSFLKVLKSDTVLEILERILIRVFCREKEASRTLMIHASNFKSLRHFRMLKDLSVAGRLWIPLLDAADEEFSYVVARMPENAKEFMCPLSSIFSLCVAQFHKLTAGSMTSHWLDFLMEEDGVRIIHDIDMKLILALSSFSRDVKEMIEVLPYYPRYVHV